MGDISIASPCGESWEGMTPSGTGRHCAKCDKVVLDLTECTREQAFERVIGGRKCVRLMITADGRTRFRDDEQAAARCGETGSQSIENGGASTSRSVATGSAIAGAMLLAACGGGDSQSSATASVPTGGAGATVTANAPTAIAVAGDMRLTIDAQWATRIAAEHLRSERGWELVSADLESAPFDADRPYWRILVRHVESFRADGSARYARDPAVRIEITPEAEVVTCRPLQ